MKTKLTLHDDSTTPQTALAGKPGPRERRRYALGLDVDLRYVVTAIQCDHGAVQPAQKLTRPQLLHWVREQTAAGHAVHTVYEACGFGYTLHEELAAAGARSILTTPMRLSPERRRKNDRLDARELCVRLARHLDGYAHELRPVRIPTKAEALRLAAQSLWQAKNYFGDLYRRWKARLGAPKAITAMAHKLARIRWHLLKFKEPFNPEVFARKEEKLKRRKLQRLQNMAATLNYSLVPNQ
jgi:hypothetical protein